MDRFEQLAARYLDELLSPSECRELATLLERDADRASSLAELYGLHRRLGALHCAPAPDATESILADIARGEKDFVESVLLDVKAERERTAHQPWTELGGMFRILWRRTGFRLGFALAASITLCLSIGIWWFPPTNQEATLSLTANSAATVSRGTETFAARDLLQLQRGDVLRSDGANAPAVLSFAPERTHVELSPGGELKLGSEIRGKHFELRSGKLTATVARQRPFRPMVITTPQAEVRVVGTSFTLTVTTNATTLEVIRGKIRFTRAEDSAWVKVGAGSNAVAAANYELLAQPLTGRILREYWTNMPGMFFVNILTSHPDFPNRPSGREYLDKFEGPSNWGEDYGARICGYLHPPQTGVYTFWIAAPSGSLWFSPDDDSRNATQIATAQNSQPHEWTKDSFQQSTTIPLVAGRKYYIEVLQKHGRGADHLAVAWQGPGREREVIPGAFLSPLKPRLKEKQP